MTPADWHPQQGAPKPRVQYFDDPCVLEQQLRDEYTNHVVPESARLGRLTVLAGWSSIASAMAFVFYGALSASLVGVRQSLIGLALVLLVYSLLGKFGARQAIRSGLNSTLLSRELFGTKGAALCPLLIASAAIYYAVFEGSIMAAALQSYFGVWDIKVWYLVVVAAMLPFMLGGLQTWLSKLNGFSLPIYFFGLVAAVVVAGVRFGWHGRWSQYAAPDSPLGIPGWVTVFVLYMGVWLLIPDTQDAARMARTNDSSFHEYVTFGWVFYAVAFVFNAVVGILIVALAAPSTGATTSEFGVVRGIIGSLGVIGLLVILVSQVRINSANFYFASISAERFVAHFGSRNLSRRNWVAAIAVIVFILMFTDVFSYITTALAWQGVLLVSWVGMMIVSWLLDRGRVVEFRATRIQSVAPGFGVWAIASGVGIYLIQVPSALPRLSALAPVISFLLATAGYLVVRAAGLSAIRSGNDTEAESLSALPGHARVRCDRCDLYYTSVEMDCDNNGRIVCLACQHSAKHRRALNEA